MCVCNDPVCQDLHRTDCLRFGSTGQLNASYYVSCRVGLVIDRDIIGQCEMCLDVPQR